MGVASEIIDLVKLVAQWAREGLNDEEIEKRLADPTGVGAAMLKRADERQKIGEDLLGRKRD